MDKKLIFKNNILFTTALTTSFLGYYKRSYSAGCANNGGTTYLCTDDATVNNSAIDLTDNDNATVSTAAGFGVNTSSGNAIEISGGGDLSFTDVNNSAITSSDASGKGLVMTSSAGDTTININGNVTAVGDAIDVTTTGGDSTITLSDSTIIASGSSGDGLSLTGSTMVNNNVTIDASSYIRGGYNGVNLLNEDGTGDTNITINGDITSLSDSKSALYLKDYTPGDFNMTIGEESNLQSGGLGFVGRVKKVGGGDINLEIDGDVTADVRSAVSFVTEGAIDNLSVTIGEESTLQGERNGIKVQLPVVTNANIVVNGDLSSGVSDGSFTYTGLYIRTQPYGANGSGGDLTVTVGETSTISGSGHGIQTFNRLTNSEILVDFRGDITTSDYGIYLTSYLQNGVYFVQKSFSGININIQDGATINSNKAIYSKRMQADVTLDGSSQALTITGSSGTAILLGEQDDTLTLIGDITINGDVDGGEESGGDIGTDNDILTLNNTNLTLSEGSTLDNFETLNVVGTSTLNGTFDFSGLDINQESGASFSVNGDLTADTLELSSGVVLNGNNTITTDLTVSSNARVAPGNSIGTINIVGDTVFSSGSYLDSEISASSADLLAVTGTVTINSGTNLNLSSLDNKSGSGDILTAGNIVGSFDNISGDTNSNKFTLLTSPTSISLVNFNTGALNANSQASINSSILFSDSLTSEIANGAFEEGRYFWMRNINRNISNSNPNLNLRSNSDGFALGAQMDISDNYKLGFSLSQIRNNSKVKDASGSRIDDSSFASIYAIYNRDFSPRVKFFTSLSLGFGYHDNKDSRAVYNSGVLSYATSKSQSHDYSASLQIGSKFKLKNDYFVMPKISSSYIHTAATGFDEFGGGVSAVKINGYDFSTLKLRESVRFGKDKAIQTNLLNNNLSISPYIEVGLAQERNISAKEISGYFSNGQSFSAQLNRNNRNFITSELGISANVNNNISAFFSFENSNNNNENRNELKGGVRIKF